MSNNKKNIVTIVSMMKCFIENNQNERAIELYEKYDTFKDKYNIEHNDISNALFIKGCINICDYCEGNKLIIINLRKMK